MTSPPIPTTRRAGSHWSSPYLRVRSGDYRVIYAVNDQDHVVTVAAVGHRREIYRALGL